MILLPSDYSKYKGWCIDTDTKNVTFLRYAAQLKKKGIRNWMWALVLMDPRLKGVDPHDPELPLETRVLIAREARRNPIYAIRECVRIPAASGNKFFRFMASLSNMASIWIFFNNINQFYMQPRQTGKTITVFTLLDVCLHIVQRGSKNLLVTKDNKLRKNNVADLKKIRDALPGYLNPYDPGIDSNNQEEISVKLFKNHLFTAVGSRDDQTANNIGRGFTVPVAAFDEAPFTNNIQITMPAAITAGNRARPDAKAMGLPASFIVTTTAGERDRKEGKYCYDMQKNACYFTEHLFDVPNRKTLYHVVKAGSLTRNIMVNIEYNHLQLGYTNAWLYEKIVENGLTDEEAINRDFFNIWSQGRLRSPLTKEQKGVINEGMMEPTHIEITKDNYMLRWYAPDGVEATMSKDMHTIGVDTSDAVGRDDVSYVFTNVRTGETTATVSFNEAYLHVAASWLGDLMVRFKKTLLVIEAKSSARTFIDTVTLKLLEHGEDPFRRMYNAIVQGSRDDRVRDFEKIRDKLQCVEFYLPYKRDFGFHTTGSTRNTLYGSVLTKLADHGRIVRDKRMIDQLMGLVEKNSRIDHVASGNDDMIFSKLLSLWVLVEGRNLSYYGIDVSKILTHMPSNEAPKILTPEEQARARIETAVKARIEEITERIESKFPSVSQKRMLLGELMQLRNRYGFSDEQNMTYDALYEKVMESTRESKRGTGTTWRIAS